MKQILHQGAESIIYVQKYLGKQMLVKERFQKKYRHAELDESLTKERMKAECRNIVRCKQAGIKTPAIYFVDVENRLIYMEYFKISKTVKEYIQTLQNEHNSLVPAEETSREKMEQLADMLGELVAKMHSNNIVHGDLTTSNLLLVNTSDTTISDLVVIDFGLSHSEASAEDKGVDLYVLERALLSTHSNTADFFNRTLSNYCKVYGKNSKEVIKKLEEVRLRGRKRTMVG